MKIFTIILGFISFLFISVVSSATSLNEQSFTIYLVRHAEKVTKTNNPPLTQCGLNRAKQLATLLEQAEIQHIYSTDTLRTEQTAAPLAEKLQLNVNSYTATDLPDFAQKVKGLKMNTLVVGHSNTTPQLTALIAGVPVNDITEAEYQMLYQVQFHGDNAKLTVLKQPLLCL
ncbi:SixA phosphatase family protein [Thalassotalea piscium]|uniref:Broad specificity phosphatase PhoE n=1 Tax=Thalassotalea piscium TaxID=1230533 RepID=A0A7X0TTZ5_9GAMM|nr:phosphoglycerate mutase family protein [Thalassotalea piscium]MBB6543812.1 broad specificity phosphatase PhoE [Thalassotalea piscium]